MTGQPRDSAITLDALHQLHGCIKIVRVERRLEAAGYIKDLLLIHS